MIELVWFSGRPHAQPCGHDERGAARLGGHGSLVSSRLISHAEETWSQTASGSVRTSGLSLGGLLGSSAPVEQISRSWRHRGKICVSPSDSWTFTAQIPQVIHRTCCTSVLGSFWGNNDVITFWIYLNLNTCSCQPPASTLNKARTCPSTLISMSSKFEVCSAWNASFIGSF